MNSLYTAVATATHGRDGRAVLSDGSLDLKLAVPKEMGGSGEGNNPEQLFAAGYAACFSSALGITGRRAGVDLSKASVTGEVSIGMQGEGFALAVVLRITLPGDIDAETGGQLVAQAHQVCPYSNAIRGNVPVELVVG
ncbi:Organic hydroperoxide resistance protein OhrB [Streptomyces sp. RB5]|uniref:Organic hydroperoxide resistance protein OhrB n=1 Tax=Streptomyces smaragdinus TaxID=2585196 RepID=A0A7K0C9A0_9ACTN|nr:organic hydroperoxide resistance protein [Streptomyces smaragdinus]MQY10031.1 Organic hydroperoxide resistance protein OhrB [Streptomyces smaragdinus]